MRAMPDGAAAPAVRAHQALAVFAAALLWSALALFAGLRAWLLAGAELAAPPEAAGRFLVFVGLWGCVWPAMPLLLARPWAGRRPVAAFGLLLALVFLPVLLSWALPRAVLGWGSLAAGGLLAAAVLAGLGRARAAGTPVLGPALAGAAVAAMVAAYGLSATHFTPVMAELARSGMVHSDSLFHADIAHLLAERGVTSVGLHGLQPIGYHALSHLWLGSMAAAFGLPPLVAYSVFFYVIAPVALAVALGLFSLATPAHAGMAARPGPALAAAFGLALTFATFNWDSFLISESHVLGTVLVLLLGAAAARALPAASSPAGLAAFLVLAAVTVQLAAQAKISAGFAAAGGLGLVALAGRIGTGRALALCAAAGASFAWAFLAQAGAEAGEPGGLFRFFHFLRYYGQASFGHVAWWYYGVYLAYAAVVSWRVLRRRPPAVADLYGLGLASAGIVAGSLVNTVAGAEIYFLSLVLFPAFAEAARGLMALVSPLPSRAVAVAVPAAAVLAVAALHLPGLRSGLDPAAPRLEERFAGQAALQRFFLPEDRRRAVEAKLAEIATVWDGLPEATRARAGFFVDPGAAAIWQGHLYCWAAPFALPAGFGAPLIFGLPPLGEGCAYGADHAWGYGDYDHAAARARALAPEAICARAREMRIATVLHVTAAGTAVLDCG